MGDRESNLNYVWYIMIKDFFYENNQLRVFFIFTSFAAVAIIFNNSRPKRERCSLSVGWGRPINYWTSRRTRLVFAGALARLLVPQRAARGDRVAGDEAGRCQLEHVVLVVAYLEVESERDDEIDRQTDRGEREKERARLR